MSALKPAWLPRVEKWIEYLKNDFYEPVGEINLEGFETDGMISPEEARKHHFEPCSTERGYSHPFGYMWVKGNITVPDSCAGKRLVMDLQFNAEATLYVNGKAYGTHRAVKSASAAREKHHYIVDNYLSRNAVTGDQYDLLAEIYCMPTLHGGLYHSVGPVLPENHEALTNYDNDIRFGTSTFGIWNEDAYQLYIDATALFSLLKVLPDTSLRAQKIMRVLKQFTYAVDFEQDENARLDNYKKVREILKPCLEAKNGDSEPTFYAIGNSHLDLAWLWRLSETERKTLRTFAAQLRHMDEYPDYKFFQSQPASYDMCKKMNPELFEKIRQQVKHGKWIAEGAMWVEPDMNLPAGESLIRQILYGKQFLKEEFDVDSQLLWLPDTFGYNASLPQILSGCGVRYMMTAKILWNYNGHESFTEQLFKWRGNDGSEVTVFIPQTYVSGTTPDSIANFWSNRVQIEDIDNYMLPFGYGDGGGGPCRDDLELLKREENLEGMPKVKFASPITFFEENTTEEANLHTYANELYFAAHQGTYTTCAKVKLANRKLEFKFKKAELLGVLALIKGEKIFDYDRFDEMWKTMLLHQFHDILPGSSISKVYEDTEIAHCALNARLDDCAETYLTAISKDAGTAIYNYSGWDRKEVLTLSAEFANGAVDANGNALAISSDNGNVYALVNVPAYGWTEINPCTKKAEFEPARLYRVGLDFRMENQYMSVLINQNGEITSAMLKGHTREYVNGKMNELRLYKDLPQWFDAWDIHESYKECPVNLADARCSIICGEGLRVCLHIERPIGSNSRLEQDIILDADARLIRFDTRVDWQETHRLLKAFFGSSVKAKKMINDIQYGFIERPLYLSDKAEKNKREVCNHRYTALADGGCGMAVINDCKYGISPENGGVSLSLLRSTMAPQMDLDKGQHEFSYAMLLWNGDFADSDTAMQAYCFNTPMEVKKGKGVFSAVRTNESNVIIDTVKPAHDRSGDLIVRVYESQSRSMHTKLTFGFPVKQAWLCDMLENKYTEKTVNHSECEFDIDCFEVKTIRLKI